MTANILVVDDTPANLRLMQNKLKAGFYQVETAESGEEALKKLSEQKHSIVLLDVMMPGMDGFEVCRRIKSNPETQQISIIMVTSLNDTKSRVKGLEAGADDFISRPVQDDILFARIRSLERLNALMRQVNLRTQTIKKLGNSYDLPNLFDASFQNANILLSEPDSQLELVISECLQEDLKANVQRADLELVSKTNPNGTVDLLLLNADHNSESDGIHAAITFGTSSSTRNTPVILLFDQADNERAQAALMAGVSDYVQTDADRSEFVARVKTQLKRQRYLQKLETLYEASISMALTDSLTGLYSRRYASQHLPVIIADAARLGQPVALIIVDIDDFKSINDTHGHAIGDLVLKKIAECLRSNLREIDLIARWGGDEFIVALPDCDLTTAQSTMTRLCNSVAEISIQHEDQHISTSVSIGGSTTSAFVMENADWLSLLRQADRALYDIKARHKGRAKIV